MDVSVILLSIVLVVGRYMMYVLAFVDGLGGWMVQLCRVVSGEW